MMVRTGSGADYAVLEAALESILTTLTGAFFASFGISVDFQAAGTDFSTPVSAGDWSSFTWGAGAMTVEVDTIALAFQGRSSGGHKCRLAVYGYKNAYSNWRLTEGEAPGIGTCVVVLQDTAGAFHAIDDLEPTWYGYVNIKPNDYWVRQAR
jgi:hypothetical protein